MPTAGSAGLANTAEVVLGKLLASVSLVAIEGMPEVD